MIYNTLQTCRNTRTRTTNAQKHAMTSENERADQIRACTYKNNMASKFEKSRTLTNDFSFIKMSWTEIVQEQFIEGIIFYLKSICFGTGVPL